MEAINLNLIPNGTNPVVHCSQYDEGREFRFNLFDGASVFVLDGTEDITCDIKKPDGNIVTAAVPNTEDDYIIVTTTLQMCACSGNSLGTINISKGGVNLYTLNFILYCERSPLENGIQSDSAIHNLESQVEEIVSEQYDSANVIFDNVPTSGHGTPYTVNSDGLYNYIPKNVSDMDDVTITTPVQGEALVFDADGNLVNGTPIINLDDLSDVTITTPTNGEILVYNDGVWENQANPASTANFAPDYDDTATYNTNDKVIYQGLLYVCLEDSVTGAWDNTKWQQISVADYTAELLPIQSGSATNTKDYIDNSIPTRTDFIRYEDKTIGAVEFTNAYYLLPSGSRPTVPSGYMFLMGIMLDYGSIQSGTSAIINVDQNGTYLFGIAGSKYSNVKVRYIYIKS